MIHDELQQLEHTIAAAKTLPEAKRKELLGLVAALRAEMNSLAETEGNAASETPSGNGQSEGVNRAVSNLESSMKGFEASHPQLVQVVNSICQTLSNLGI